MSKRLTSHDIARLAGLSQSTVSRVLRKHPSVRPATRERVMAVIDKHEYLPSAAARLMKTNRSGTIAVVVENLANPLYPLLLQQLVDRLSQQGLRATVWELDGPMDEATTRSIAQSPVDGVIFATATDDTLPQLERIAADKPVILINRSVRTQAFDTVVSDNAAGGAAVARYFLSAGRRRLGLLSSRSPASTIREREEGFLAALAGQGAAQACTRGPLAFGAFSYDSGHRAIQALLAEDPAIDSVFCTNDIIAIGALDGARALGRRVPEDLWLVGYDDIPMARWDCIALSTVRQPLAEMSAAAVERLLARIADPSLAPRRWLLPNELLLRRTTN
ncbi:LacI family DNA-binding transcriptional regulator [Orrella sp. JC864]|uniref:LacI family DNA-binding transcriptional regulator n=1 Tax=Orrella sp. JC864 TaxID=3120298 RepID=UPI0030097518